MLPKFNLCLIKHQFFSPLRQRSWQAVDTMTFIKERK